MVHKKVSRLQNDWRWEFDSNGLVGGYDFPLVVGEESGCPAPSLPSLIKLWKQKNPPESSGGFFIDLAGIRTQDPIIKSDVLYQLSYEV